ncbi:hypothetical protein AVEN_162221-1 [Araneus ventricosus]|uniref:Uncharacterized protein n=1 Tax=Araneus ventricosus TaxID=182803 RepID=A0A4Y2EXR4_ARAVE|nr:hypothetical protein AVEN_162221-1 [Araneus ventricosus]
MDSANLVSPRRLSWRLCDTSDSTRRTPRVGRTIPLLFIRRYVRKRGVRKFVGNWKKSAVTDLCGRERERQMRFGAPLDFVLDLQLNRPELQRC